MLAKFNKSIPKRPPCSTGIDTSLAANYFPILYRPGPCLICSGITNKSLQLLFIKIQRDIVDRKASQRNMKVGVFYLMFILSTKSTAFLPVSMTQVTVLNGIFIKT